ncbi:MAG: hypothetical protein E7563_01765 [Ruminococcaceae bacterium]|nr:hypothetical protein [Oscillospiraceae bacterium]
MKVCKLVHINDGNEVEIRNSGRLWVETYPTTEEIINLYIEKGFTVKQIMPDVIPAQNISGNLTFYKGGVLVYFEKEVERMEDADDSFIRDYICNLETQFDKENKATDEFEFDESQFDFDEFYDDDSELFTDNPHEE